MIRLHLFLMIISLSVYHLKAQDKYKIILPVDSSTQKITYDSVLNFKGVLKNQLFSDIEQWVSINYKSTKDVVQLTNREEGILIVKGIFPDIQFRGMASGRDVRHTAIFKIKDEKIKLTLTNFANVFVSEEKPIEVEIESKWGSSLYSNQRIDFQQSLDKRIKAYYSELFTILIKPDNGW
jgi:hypothetical protein